MADGTPDDARVTDERRRLFEREVARLTDRLYGTALRLTRDPDEAEDVVAEAVGRAWARLGALRQPDQIEGWLFRILNNTFISRWRRKRCRQDLEDDLDSPEQQEAGSAEFSFFQQLHHPFLLWWGTPEQHVLDSLLQQDIQRAIDALPDVFRVIVVMVELEGYTYREVSEILGIPLGTVQSRLKRGRSLLQKALWERARDAGIAPGGMSAGPDSDSGGQ